MYRNFKIESVLLHLPITSGGTYQGLLFLCVHVSAMQDMKTWEQIVVVSKLQCTNLLHYYCRVKINYLTACRSDSFCAKLV